MQFSLEKGLHLCLYPEGTRSHDGRLYKGRTGVARMALLARASSGRGQRVDVGQAIDRLRHNA